MSEAKDDLIERVEAATEGGNDLDRDIAIALGWTPPAIGLPFWYDDEGNHWSALPDWSTSIDAALALVERVRPGTWWDVLTMRCASFSWIAGWRQTRPWLTCRATSSRPFSDLSREGSVGKVTEEQAATMICCGPPQTINGREPLMLCLASKCMAWRWERGWLSPGGDQRVKPRAGFCGLSREPSDA